MLFSVGTSLLKFVVYLNRAENLPRQERMEKDKSVKDTVAAIHYKNESQEGWMGTNKEIKIFEDNSLDKNWRDNFNMGA